MYSDSSMIPEAEEEGSGMEFDNHEAAKRLESNGNEEVEYKALPGGPSNDTHKETNTNGDQEVPILENVYWKEFGLLVFVWVAFLALQIAKKTLLLFDTEQDNNLFDCLLNFELNAEKAAGGACGILAGVVCGLLGLGGGFILGPLFLELGIPPQVSSATTTFAMTFSSSMGMTYLHNEPNVIIHRDLKPRLAMGLTSFVIVWFGSTMHLPLNRFASDGPVSSCTKGALSANSIQGQYGSHFEPKTVPPPLPNESDWEIDPSELDFSNSAMIGKGSFGEILKAGWGGTPVAIKRILPFLSDDRLVMRMTYLHNEPNVIIHRDLKPRNVLLVNTSADHLKVGDFGLSKLIRVQNCHDVYKMTGETGSCDPPMSNYEFYEAAKYVIEGHRPIFRSKGYIPELRMLTEEQCWAADMNQRPSFSEILKKLEKIKGTLPTDHHWKFGTSSHVRAINQGVLPYFCITFSPSLLVEDVS
ncbi:hypothetical protein IFM89_017187 [Coptis chinensis]|uniref:Protein kinase domain-containing protein n=1 Tax=Coptis chinensis TaxID=261450 RepID=A0A835IWK2_9MAGN|nr:hypothetical protein IFM89_017187 [Coptis chinensis]